MASCSKTIWKNFRNIVRKQFFAPFTKNGNKIENTGLDLSDRLQRYSYVKSKRQEHQKKLLTVSMICYQSHDTIISDNVIFIVQTSKPERQSGNNFQKLSQY